MDRTQIARLLALAATQHSVVSIGQAAGLGISPGMLRSAVGRQWLRPERRGIYSVTGAPPSKWQPVVAAALAVGPDAVISHRSAAEIHGFHGVMADQPEVSIPNRGGRRLTGVRIHRPRHLDCGDIEVRHGFRVTVPVRTVVDLAPTIGDDHLGRILDEGAISRLWTAEQVIAGLDQLVAQGRPGVVRLRALLDLRVGEGMADSRLEQRVWRVLRPAVAPFVVHHAEILGGERIEMDLAWPGLKIDGEVDGMAVRAASRTKFERQCRRENLLAAHGWRIVHFTAQMDDLSILAQVVPLLLLSG